MAQLFADQYTTADSGEKVGTTTYPGIAGTLAPEPTQTAIPAPGSIDEPSTLKPLVYLDPGQVGPLNAPPPFPPTAACEDMNCAFPQSTATVPGAATGQAPTVPGPTRATAPATAADAMPAALRSAPWWLWLVLAFLAGRAIAGR